MKHFPYLSIAFFAAFLTLFLGYSAVSAAGGDGRPAPIVTPSADGLVRSGSLSGVSYSVGNLVVYHRTTNTYIPFATFAITEPVAAGAIVSLYIHTKNNTNTTSLMIYGANETYASGITTWDSGIVPEQLLGETAEFTSTGWITAALSAWPETNTLALIDADPDNNLIYIYESGDVYPPALDYAVATPTPSAPITPARPAAPTSCYDFETLPEGAQGTITSTAVALGNSLHLSGTETFTADTPPAYTVVVWDDGNPYTILDPVLDDDRPHGELYRDYPGSGVANVFTRKWIIVPGIGLVNSGDQKFLSHTGMVAASGAGGINQLAFSNGVDSVNLTADISGTVSLRALGASVAVDQLAIFDYWLTDEERAWLYNDGTGRWCAELLEPTAITLHATPAYQVGLPSGATADIYATANAGDLIIGSLFVMLLTLTIGAGIWITSHRTAAE